MSLRQWMTPGRVTTGLLSLGGLVALLATATGTQRAQSMGATRHGQMLVARDAGAADVVGLATVDPPTAPGHVLTSDDAGLPVWRASSGGLPSGTGIVTVSGGTGGVLTASGTSAAALLASLGPTTPTSGALHHWRLSGAGPWSDLGSGAATLTATGSWETDQPGVSIYRGGVAITSPATGDRLSASTTIPSGSSLTIALTVGARYDNSSSWSVVRMLAMAWNGSTATRNLLAVLTSAGAIYASAGIAGSIAQTGNVVVDWTRPHRIMLTHNQGTGAVVLYLDGVQVGTATDSGSRAALNEVTVGGIVGNGFGVATALPALADVQLWTSARSAGDAVTDYLNARAAMGR